MFINHGSQGLGIARGAIASALDIARRRKGATGVAFVDMPRLQEAIVRATALVDSASDYLYGTSQRLWDQALAGPTDATLRAKTRLATAHAVSAAQKAVDLLHGVLGTQSVFAGNAIERSVGNGAGHGDNVSPRRGGTSF